MTRRWTTIAITAGVIGLAAIAFLALRSFELCQADSRAAMTQIPAFEGRDVDPDPNFLDSHDVCSARLETTAPADAVLAHYESELTSRGWDVRIKSPAQLEAESGCGAADSGCPVRHGLTAARGPLCFAVDTEQYPRSEPPGLQAIYLDVRRC